MVLTNGATPVLLPGKSHGRRSLVGCSPRGCEESDMTERLHFQFSLSFIGKGNGNPLQCSCLENPRDGEAWWAAVCGVAQSWTRLKRLSSSSSSDMYSPLSYYTDYLHCPKNPLCFSYSSYSSLFPMSCITTDLFTLHSFVFSGMSSSGSHTMYHFPGGSDGKESACQRRRPWFDSWVRKIHWRRKCQGTQCPCLENPMGRGTWQATVYEVAKSRTRLSN